MGLSTTPLILKQDYYHEDVEKASRFGGEIATTGRDPYYRKPV
jgi:hypothetical protein